MKMPFIGQEFVSFKVETPDVGRIDFTDNVFAVTNINSWDLVSFFVFFLKNSPKIGILCNKGTNIMSSCLVFL